MKFTNNQNLPAPLVALLTQDFYSKGASEYSVTELMSPPRIRRLREQHNKEMVQDVTQLIASKLGTFMHGKLEAKELPGHTNEERVFKEVDGVTISGAIDLQLDDGGVVITDYKFVKSWAVVNHNSSPAVGAAIEGYPIFVTDPARSQCREIANTDLSEIETPTLFDRQSWVERISMFHWNFEELKSGECWHHMRRYIM